MPKDLKKWSFSTTLWNGRNCGHQNDRENNPLGRDLKTKKEKTETRRNFITRKLKSIRLHFIIYRESENETLNYYKIIYVFLSDGLVTHFEIFK